MEKNKTSDDKGAATSVYVSAQIRPKLDGLALEVGFKRGKQMSSSAFVHYLIDEFGELARDKLLNC
ncbi:hypothetical protein KCQ_05431 [Pectobacterium atrosepticum ICMP 1526]|uniref:hypothetical protein n=1 Tax=Pectobacterium atrosepticum TaxID=29471 RepID=UPI00050367C7|nr:hypothetical protein [Pectobacterium atrosepticum]KFX10735.1 hypothetical protein JV34_22740 [Pectobacterium atrosepticum]KMK87225.1 hypothetical protein KCQ_05431 [Pectobacterium atrosepticum ICMP 1526]